MHINFRALVFLGACLGLFGFTNHALGQSQILINQFTISSEGADVLLTWELQDENEVKEYRIFRRINQEPTSAHVITIPANGNGSYTFLDDAIFKTESRVIHYDLHVVTRAKVHRFTRSLGHNPTSVQRTWGSIKAMFRY